MESMYPFETSAFPPTPRDGITALVVDDETHVRHYLRLVLGNLGVSTVWEAGTGEEAVRLYQQHQPTVVFLDQNMPVLCGSRTLAQLRQIDPAVAVVVVTSENTLSTVKEFVAQGAIGYILKSIPRHEVSQRVAAILDGLVAERA